MTNKLIRPSFPADRRLTSGDFITKEWDAFFRALLNQLPRPGEFTINSSDTYIKLSTNGRSSIDYRLDGTTYLDNTLHFPQLYGDITNNGLTTTLKNVGTPISNGLVKLSTDYAGRVSSTTPITTGDLTPLLDSTYVNSGGDTMTGDLQVPNLIASGNVNCQNINVSNDIVGVDRVMFDTGVYAPSTPIPGTLRWNSVDDTLDLGLQNGVTLQVGQEMFARVRNMSGATIPNGSVVNIVGGSSMALLIEPFIADGSHLNLALLGVMTHDCADGATGYCTVWGNVRDLDTTAFTTGDILYASPTVYGGFTNIRPTAPNNVIPVAIVTSVGALGSIFVKPVVENDKYYGRFEKTLDQSPTVINTATLIPIDSTIEANGVTLTSGSRITFAHSGVYSITVNFQVTSGSSSQKNLWLWYRRNGTDVPGSSIINTTVTNGASQTISRTNFFNMTAGEYLELYMAGDSTNITLDATPATTFAPSSSAVRINVIQIQQ